MYTCVLQIGDLKDHYHFFHSRTIKRSTLSSRGRHSFISMEPKVSLMYCFVNDGLNLRIQILYISKIYI